ncbi:type II secretion system protein [Pontiellaceae bacterium B12219]|nr:type II secretion system protein [Pontiellaceae bacterium B12219]
MLTHLHRKTINCDYMSTAAKQYRKLKEVNKNTSPEFQENLILDSSALDFRHRKNTSKSAFTLIEVLIAMFISVMAVSSTYMLLTYSRDILRSSSNRIEAMNNARTAMEYVRSLDFDSEKLDINNYTPTVNGLTFWYNVAEYDGNDALKQITVRTDWTSELSDAVRQVELVTIISAPLHSE